MSERTNGPIAISALRVGRTDVGAAVASVDDDGLTINVRIDGDDRALRLRFSSIDVVHVSGDEIDIVVRDGRHVLFTAPAGLREELFTRSRALPELTRTLRAFGSSRARHAGTAARSTDAAEQQRFFAPFLEARRRAGSGDDALAVFSGVALADALTKILQDFASERQPEPGPARRALEAELVDASEPLFDALTRLRQLADDAGAAMQDFRRWRAWSAQLRATFETADRVWMSLDAALEIAHRQAAAEAARKTKLGWKAR